MKRNPGLILVGLGFTILIICIISLSFFNLQDKLLDKATQVSSIDRTSSPNAFVDGIRRISPPAQALATRPGQTPQRFVTVNFQSMLMSGPTASPSKKASGIFSD